MPSGQTATKHATQSQKDEVHEAAEGDLSHAISGCLTDQEEHVGTGLRTQARRV
ncbi:MAG: hypothetical protein J2P36_28960 [Ktedonobacteraceae bacterium]|nr:hypothetical protein [Ktedonobacteraceae bacterium]